MNSISPPCSALYLPDINECSDPFSNDCHDDAVCIDVEGSYRCECQEGFTGDGIQCQGMWGTKCSPVKYQESQLQVFKLSPTGIKFIFGQLKLSLVILQKVN